MKKGDRVIVKLPLLMSYHGVIVGESREGHAWLIVKDGTKWPRGIHKSFCKPENEDDRPYPA